ncbi:SERTA domain-containing protein 2b isoform 1-T5 [Clarias gariepinus]|uniref:SERTA domain-containing protein 2b n=1 Tax=Clarias gariepinus TaxID=13013 RepID=UPI00234C9DD9|nr:SERTA domain-containing protein 2b [Clarias gariepinus]XP_053358180.1 SERTA domain-containing protein 2b [Clarias gariepinus]XP_053358181.1 SERTA domain-containing protein 2b [Clarias gariepinus]XP_053358182.1 SERTA domain-containing protein 2b [Clarias gariepinus]
MLGKGAKRKLDEDDEGVEGKAVAMADGLSKVSYTLQRQTIFNISLMKLYSQRALAEPSLEKRVLINNMLRRIQDELKQEGSLRPLFFPPSPPPDHPMDEGFREAQPAFGVLSVVASPPVLSQQPPVPPPSPAVASPTPLDACLTPASLLEEDSAVFCTSSPSLHHSPSRLRPLMATDSFSSALDEIEELCPSSTAAGSITTSSLTVPLPMPLQPSSQPTTAPDSKNCTKSCSSKPEGSSPLAVERLTTGTAGTAATESRGMDALPSSGLDMSTLPSSSSSSGFLTDLALDDILFADIDTSMYDFDPCTSAAGASPSKLSPVVSADDLIKTLTPNQPFKMDLTELDHIMEVLVGS